jgi:hypothetical protein
MLYPISILQLRSLLLLAALLLVLVGCGGKEPTPAEVVVAPTPAPIPTPVVSEPIVSVPSPIGLGQEIGISVNVDSVPGIEIEYQWTHPEGQGEILDGPGTSAITYRAPTQPGTYKIGVEITAAGAVFERSVFITVGDEATATPTPMPTEPSVIDTPVPNDTPSPAAEQTEEPTEEPIVEITIKEPQVQVLCPIDASCRFSVQGELVGVEPGSGYRIVVFVNPGDPNLWWPHPVPSTGIKADGTWEGEAQIGDKPEQPGHQFNIAAVVMSAEEVISLDKTFQGLPEGIARSNYVDLITAGRVEQPEWCVPFSREPISKITLQGDAQLTFPEDCADGLEYENKFVGTSSGLPEDVRIWVLVYPENRQYYPQSDDAGQGFQVQPVSGSWSVKTYLGMPDSGPEKFDIVVVLANREASDFFSEKLKTWAAAAHWPGLGHAELPAGIMEVQTISVMRTR